MDLHTYPNKTATTVFVCVHVSLWEAALSLLPTPPSLSPKIILSFITYLAPYAWLGLGVSSL